MADEQETKKKPKRPTALKRDIQNRKRRSQNRIFKSQVRSAIRTLEELMKSSNEQSTDAELNTIYSLMDKGVKRGIFKLNKASRTKARIAARVKAKA